MSQNKVPTIISDYAYLLTLPNNRCQILIILTDTHDIRACNLSIRDNLANLRKKKLVNYCSFVNLDFADFRKPLFPDFLNFR